jgi:outer membrane lipoprotein carrier protein
MLVVATRLRRNASVCLQAEYNITRSVRFERQLSVIRLAVCCLLAFCPALAAAEPVATPPAALHPLLKSVENRYNRAQSLTLSFSETYEGSRRPEQTESGTLYLRKPGRMRWEYSLPAGKIFLSDGKDVYLYSPEERRAEKSKLKESDDMRAPLAFLLGKLDFAKEFRSFAVRNEGSDSWIVAEPKSQNLAYTKVEFLALPSGEIRRVRVTGQDQSKLVFVFSGERLNTPVSPALFTFRPPPGVQVVEAER